MMKKIICFGEVLWDVFPTHKKIGGAPLNVAVRLRSFGNQASIISSIGEDQDGNDILEFLREKGVKIDAVQINSNYPTGSVSVLLDESGSATYTIDFPRAWDYINSNEIIEEDVASSDAFIFGSLAARHEYTKNSLMQLLKRAKFKVFDVNLRAPHYTQELLIELMQESDFIKFNEEELLEIAQYLGSSFSKIEENVRYISEATNTLQICVTRGGDGALLFMNNEFYQHSGFKVKVVNTVGAGDSFLASLIHCLLQEKSPEEALEFACAVGGLVTQSEGANPELSEEDIDNFKK